MESVLKHIVELTAESVGQKRGHGKRRLALSASSVKCSVVVSKEPPETKKVHDLHVHVALRCNHITDHLTLFIVDIREI